MTVAETSKDPFAELMGSGRGADREDAQEPVKRPLAVFPPPDGVRQPPDADIAGIENEYDRAACTWPRQDASLSRYLERWQRQFGEVPYWNCRFDGGVGEDPASEWLELAVSGDGSDTDAHTLLVYGDGSFERWPLS